MAPAKDDTARFIDSHAHLADPAFAEDRNDVVFRARESGASAIICIGSLREGEAAQSLALAYPKFIFWTTGVHPHDAASFDPSRDIEALRHSAAEGSLAVGECGLDYHYDNSPRDSQIRAFEAQIAIASETGLPLVVHTRDAEADTITMVRDAASAGVRGVLHCFTGSAQLATVALESGWYISFSGIVTFRKWSGDDVVRLVPDARLLAESDSPYLAPAPFRGKRNEPAWVAHTIARLAEVRGVAPPQVSAAVSRNAETLFGLALRAAA